MRPGDRVATLGWNTQHHLEAYLAIPSIGAVLHTLNLRLHCDDISYIVNDAEDTVLLLDASTLPIYEQFKARVKIRKAIVMSPAPGDHGPDLLDYETLLAAADPARYVEPRLDEQDAAAMCYTSGTTGRPKGVLYSHRALMLHSLAQAARDCLGVGEQDVDPAGRSDVSRQRLGPAVHVHDGRRHAGVSRDRFSIPTACSSCSSRSGSR